MSVRVAVLSVLFCVAVALSGRPGPAWSQSAATTPGQQSPSAPPNPQQQEMERLHKEGLEAYDKGNLASASQAWQAALERAQALKDEPAEAKFLNNLGLIYFSQGQFSKALDDLTRALILREKSGNQQDISGSLNNLGAVYNHLGQFDKAVDYYARALALREKLGNRQDIAASFNNLGEVYLRQNHPAQAQQAFARAVSLYEEVEEQVGEAGRLGAFQQTNQGNLYTRYAHLLLLLHPRQPVLALCMAERGRGRGLARQAAQNRTDLTHFLKPSDAAKLSELTTEWSSADRIRQAIQQQGVPADKEAQQVYQSRLLEAQTRAEEARRQLEVWRTYLTTTYPDYRRLQGTEPTTPAILRALARRHPDTLYLEYVLADEKTLLSFTLSARSGCRAFTLPMDDNTFLPLTQRWRTALIQSLPEESHDARQLYQILLHPLENAGLLFPARRLVIVADGPLLNLPFAALMDRRGRRLIARYPLSHTVSLGMLTWPQNKSRPAASLLCTADPFGQGGEALRSVSRGGFTALPSARTEGQAIVGLFPRAVGLVGASATEATVKREMGKYALLHFATHAHADSQNGLRSFLALAPGNGEDGFLDGNEIAEQKLTAKLAVLSACESGQGQEQAGEGLLGLAWAFRAAGCPCVVASQWSVNDAATSKLMIAFYKALKRGLPKDEALRQAMLAVKRQKPPPYYWAAFQVIGDTRPLSSLPRELTGH